MPRRWVTPRLDPLARASAAATRRSACPRCPRVLLAPPASVSALIRAASPRPVRASVVSRAAGIRAGSRAEGEG
ncbi:hypothetical protein GQ55_1G228900 [Panicum hallii var. hallii]|uniref:Uncharacterized protein n=1 Tax=Panicum hallii var. hallii TaxID=1504633 RepID=A0A2T7F6N1_9POAL|nr:hypothetical protein GQ55_1G228900 [Panicum hallii var. hallii]